jgi:hypothetical protein
LRLDVTPIKHRPVLQYWHQKTAQLILIFPPVLVNANHF